MKKSLTLIVIITSLAALGLIACKKESATPKTTQDKVAGKWKFQSSVIDNYYSGSSHIVTYTGIAADYVDFRNDGRVYSFVDGSYDTSAYKVISNAQMWIDSDSSVFDIQALTDTDLKIYMKEVYAPGDYHESTVNLKR